MLTLEGEKQRSHPSCQALLTALGIQPMPCRLSEPSTQQIPRHRRLLEPLRILMARLELVPKRCETRRNFAKRLERLAKAAKSVCWTGH
ncbi:unnamed protein product [Closterium sp. NIES-54]